MKNTAISKRVEDNEAHMKHILGESHHILYRHFGIPKFNKIKGLLVFIDSLTDVNTIEEVVLKPLMRKDNGTDEVGALVRGDYAEILMNSTLSIQSARSTDDWQEIFDGLLAGESVLFIDKANTALIRRRIRDYGLRFEGLSVGKRTRTDVSLVYIENLVDKSILDELKT